jgi:hypothetical protein
LLRSASPAPISLDEKVILKGQVLEVRNVDGRLYVARKAKKPDEWDRPIPAYDPYAIPRASLDAATRHQVKALADC